MIIILCLKWILSASKRLHGSLLLWFSRRGFCCFLFYFSLSSCHRVQRNIFNSRSQTIHAHFFSIFFNSNRYLIKLSVSQAVFAFNEGQRFLRDYTLNTVWCQRTFRRKTNAQNFIFFSCWKEMDNIQMVSFFFCFSSLFLSVCSMVVRNPPPLFSSSFSIFQCYRHQNRARSIKCVLNGFYY